ncbi:MAG: elongation factor G [Clostridiales bacterium]|nr:elongation factor G [Clostridiales bacterium]
MAVYKSKDIRNIALLGHGGSGKTSLVEAMLYVTGAIDRMGKTTDGNTVSDYDPEEIKRGYSLSASLVPVESKGVKINVIDAPGYLEFAGEVKASLAAADSAVIVVDAKAGVEVGTELAWDNATSVKKPCAFFVNKSDDNEANFKRVFDELHSTFGMSVCPVLVPVTGHKGMFADLIEMKAYTYDPKKGTAAECAIPDSFADEAEEYKTTLYDALSMTSEEMMEKILMEEPISREEAFEAIHSGILDDSIVPVYSGSAVNLWSVTTLIDAIIGSFPNPVIAGKGAVSEEGEPAVFAYKTVADSFGKQTFFKVMRGNLGRDTVLKNRDTDATEKFSHIYTMRGKKQTEVDALCTGDLGMISKLSNTATNNTLYAGEEVSYPKIEFPTPYLSLAIQPASKGDEDKISGGISRILEEDLTLKYENNVETKQMLLYGMSEIHLDVIVSKLKSRYGVSVTLTEPKIAYRETIKGKASVQGKHKKQSGGSGQYGDVRITFSHGEEEGLTFTQSVVGGNVPKQYYPAVEKGLLEAMQHGVLAGYPVVNLAADLYDGSYHPVDSNEISFKLAAKLAYKTGLPQAKPVILEPVGSLKVYAPDSLVGDIMGDLNKRRGRVLGMNPWEGKKGYTCVEAEVPKAEMADYVVSLRAMSQGRGHFDYEIIRYDEVPANLTAKIVADAKIEDDE